IIIETSNEVFMLADARRPLRSKPGRFVVLSFSDTGVGMDKATQEHLFEPFFTTKAAGEGTGLGLATVYGIVTQSNAHIVAECDALEGTRFRIYLPSVDASALEVPRPEKLESAPRGSETVLLVEDEAAVRDLVRDFLRRNGYFVLVAASGDEAVSLAMAHRG